MLLAAHLAGGLRITVEYCTAPRPSFSLKGDARDYSDAYAAFREAVALTFDGRVDVAANRAPADGASPAPPPPKEAARVSGIGMIKRVGAGQAGRTPLASRSAPSLRDARRPDGRAAARVAVGSRGGSRRRRRRRRSRGCRPTAAGCPARTRGRVRPTSKRGAARSPASASRASAPSRSSCTQNGVSRPTCTRRSPRSRSRPPTTSSLPSSPSSANTPTTAGSAAPTACSSTRRCATATKKSSHASSRRRRSSSTPPTTAARPPSTAPPPAASTSSSCSVRARAGAFDRKGATPMHAAAAGGDTAAHEAAVRALAAAGADPSVADREGAHASPCRRGGGPRRASPRCWAWAPSPARATKTRRRRPTSRCCEGTRGSPGR